MKRRVAIYLGLVFVSVAVAVAVIKRPQEPIVTFGPHSTPVKFVPFSEANPKPWFDFKLPVFGRIAYPLGKALPGVNPTDDPRFIAGYVVVERPGAYWQNQDTFQMGDFFPFNDSQATVLKVGYPKSEADAFSPAIIGVPGESIEVHRKFDPTKLPARYEDAVATIGKLKVTARLGSFQDQGVSIDLLISAPADQGTIQVETTSKTSSGSMSSSGPLPTRFQVNGDIAADGTITVNGQISYGLGDSPLGAKTPLKIELRPRAPGAIRSI